MPSPESKPTFRSPLLMNRGDSALLIVDIQEKLIPCIPGNERLVWNIGRLVEGAKVLDVEVRATEQYPKGLGHTVEDLAKELTGNAIPEKSMFSCRECKALLDQLSDAGVHNVLLCGIETHVCVAQTAFDLLAQGYNVFLCLDAIGSRFGLDHETAIRRMENSGVVPTTTEAVLFEWCEKAGSDEFKQISTIVQRKYSV